MISVGHCKKVLGLEDDDKAEETRKVLYQIAEILVDEYLAGHLHVEMPTLFSVVENKEEEGENEQTDIYPHTIEDYIVYLIEDGKLSKEYLKMFNSTEEDGDLCSSSDWNYFLKDVNYLVSAEKGY